MNLLNAVYRIFAFQTAKLIVVSAMIVALSTALFAWNKPGHMVTGAIAARELKSNDPQALARVVALFKRHPYYRNVWRPIVNQRAGIDDEAVVLFAYAARWADDARGSNDHREFWHYINYPYKPVGQPASITVADPLDDNIENAFAENLDVLRGAGNTDVQKAKALAWLFHLAGDSHQPLHSSALFTTDYADGDRGGTRFWVRFQTGSRGVKLHALWDNMVIDSERFQDVHNSYLQLANRYRRGDLSNVGEDDQTEWIKESLELAKEKTYRRGGLRGGDRAGTAVVLPNGYINENKPLAAQRIVMSGYRMSDLLERLF